MRENSCRAKQVGVTFETGSLETRRRQKRCWRATRDTFSFARLRVQVRLVLRGSARKTLVGGLVPFIPASELVFDDFVQIDATGAIVATEGDAIPDVLRGFQLVHRRFVTAPDNVQVVSNEQVGAFRTEFGGQKAAAAASARCFRWAKR